MGMISKKRSKEAITETSAVDEEVPKKIRRTQDVSAKVEVQEIEQPRLSPEEFRNKFQISAVRREEQTEEPELPDPVQSFSEAPFGKKIKEALLAAGFDSPSPIQAQAWPIAAAGFDLVAVAKTGSGKTLAFLLPAFKIITKMTKGETAPTSSKSVQPMILVLAPTRELATQIQVECSKFASSSKVRSLAVFGGAAKNQQAKGLKEDPHILVATPGRLQDFMNSKEVCLQAVKLLVLDEADRMLDMGFEPEIAKILTEVPADKQTLLFTATWPKAVKKIASKYLKEDYFHVNVGQTEELAANKAVSQQFYKLDDDEKDNKFHQILDSLPSDAKLICFGNTKRRVEALSKTFWSKGYSNAALHGDKQQWERDRDLADFAKGDTWLLFATDVCARGLDIKSVTHVVNFDMARDVESYVHRIGRTGRAGATGVSITFWNQAYDTECAPALVKIAKEAGQDVPEWLEKAASKQSQVKNKAWRY